MNTMSKAQSELRNVQVALDRAQTAKDDRDVTVTQIRHCLRDLKNREDEQYAVALRDLPKLNADVQREVESELARIERERVAFEALSLVIGLAEA
jgi:phage-related protein